MGKTKRALGPLDKRKRVTRCQPCSARRIKCEGGTPCKYCSRNGKNCLPATAVNDGYQFVEAKQVVYAQKTTIYDTNPQSGSNYMALFAAFIQRCQFTGDFVSVDNDLMGLVQSSHVLHDLTLAIGALEASRRASCRHSYASSTPQFTAFVYYGKALRGLREQLTKAGAAQCEKILWSTFLFGLFELASESSGELWAKHMFHGTSRLLSLAGPIQSSSNLYQRLFNGFRVLEANRAILFGVDTFLSEPAWVVHYSPAHTLFPHYSSFSNSVDTIFVLKLRVACFAKRFFDRVESIPYQSRPGHPTIQALAHEGLELSHELCQWDEDCSKSVLPETTHTRLAHVDFHALVLFLCQNYGYYACWNGLKIPSLALEDAEAHVKAILDLAEKVQTDPHVPGVLLLFALRTAGVHAKTITLMHRTIRQLDSIYWEGFVVSERIKLDLQELWKHEQRPYCSQPMVTS